MKISEVLNCSFSSWYPRFKDYTIKSQILPLPQEFVDYLLADQVVLPEGTVAMSASDSDTEDNRNTEDVIDWATQDILTPVAEAPSFPEFEVLLKNTIRRLGGQVFPKLNWSAPKDATWISFDRTLKCTCTSDVYLLLKSSDFISHDLTQPFKHCCDDENLKNETSVKYELVLRKWQELNPAYEFRCFVKDNKLIDCFDVYRRCQGKLLLLDFNPFGRVTDGLLYTWEELESDDLSPADDSQHHVPEMRCVESPSGVRSNPYGAYAFPKDFIDISSGDDPAKLIQLLQLKTQEQNGTVSSDEESTDYPGT
ncbi:cell division cycle protein 123 homolog [Ruditapes philippinarum]|uniref:cell division cycle protein 123 homolog n=1 Tax=Ruditapes philippinarum TaxID=129788 RepID=UPI00295B4771|nr:cell division cycle protein 123 homolog [Ruditapes philippinarum]